MNITELAASYGTTTTTDTTAKKEIGQEEFLTLLVEQIKNQDPLNPMESMEFTSQLTQFSSLEQLFGVNDTLSAIQESLAVNKDDNALDYIGKTILAPSNSLAITDGEVSSATYNLADDAEVSIYIYDQWGSQVRRIDVGSQTAGEHEFSWDGYNNSGSLVADGQYTFEVSAYDANGNSVTSTTYLSGMVSGVNYSGDDTYLTVGNWAITPDQVEYIRTNEDQ